MRKSTFRMVRLLGGFAFLAVAVGYLVPASLAGHGPGTLWASPTGAGTACTAKAPCSLGQAVGSAASGDTVKATSGTYVGGVVISTPIDLVGAGGSLLDATTSANGVGIQILASDTTVEHFTVENAPFEGILVGDSSLAAAPGATVSDVTIDHDNVVENDRGIDASPEVGECASTPGGPGDCGEAIHLESVTDSVVEHTLVQDNAGGILLSDQFGPTSDNTIDHDTILDNTDDCGVTLASHTSNGVFDNLIEHNVADGNGVAGQGAGYLIAGGGPFTRAFGNVITHNEASGNGLGGVTIHQHFAGDLNGNVITFNDLSNNNVDGDFDFLTPAPETTDIIVASGPPPPPAPPLPPPLQPGPLTGTVIEHNHLSDASVGIWTLNAPSVIDKNQFSGITTPVSTN